MLTLNSSIAVHRLLRTVRLKPNIEKTWHLNRSKQRPTIMLLFNQNPDETPKITIREPLLKYLSSSDMPRVFLARHRECLPIWIPTNRWGPPPRRCLTSPAQVPGEVPADSPIHLQPQFNINYSCKRVSDADTSHSSSPRLVENAAVRKGSTGRLHIGRVAQHDLCPIIRRAAIQFSRIFRHHSLSPFPWFFLALLDAEVFWYLWKELPTIGSTRKFNRRNSNPHN